MSNRIDEDDIALFRQVTTNVNPLNHDKVVHERVKPDAHPRQTRRDEQSVLRESLEMAPGYDLETGDELCFSRPGIQHQIVRKLKRGHYVVRAVLDLHGLYVREAHETLIEFLSKSRQDGIQCVRIIHGKGRRSPHGRPVLKNKVFNWLRQRDEVLSFCSAQRHDGGTGAIYVLLKR